MAQHLDGLQISHPRFNPQDEQVFLHFQAAEEGFATLVVFAPDGAWLLSLGEVRIGAGTNTLTWAGLDSEGQPVPDGLYTLELFGFDLQRRPAAAALLQAHVEVLNVRASGARGDLTMLLRWLPWGDPAPLAVSTPAPRWHMAS